MACDRGRPGAVRPEARDRRLLFAPLGRVEPPDAGDLRELFLVLLRANFQRRVVFEVLVDNLLGTAALQHVELGVCQLRVQSVLLARGESVRARLAVLGGGRLEVGELERARVFRGGDGDLTRDGVGDVARLFDVLVGQALEERADQGVEGDLLEGQGLDGDPVSGEGGDGGRVGLLGGGLALVGQEGLVLCEVDVSEEPRRKLLLDVQGLSFFLGGGGLD